MTLAGRVIRLAAMPTFAVMALLTAVVGGGPMEALCSPAHGSALTGMVPMYLLMSGFHSPPWLELIASRRPPAPQCSASGSTSASSHSPTSSQIRTTRGSSATRA